MKAEPQPSAVEIPPELILSMREFAGLRAWFNAMSPSHRREIGRWITEAKTPSVRQKRADQMAERMELAREGEREVPPILRVLFQQDARAAQGWTLLTRIQRRNHLLAIFYYQSTEARQRRAAKAVDEALRAWEKRQERAPQK